MRTSSSGNGHLLRKFRDRGASSSRSERSCDRIARPKGRSCCRSPTLNATLLITYVFGEDDYRNNGISRWDAYRSPGGELGELFVVCIALMVAVAVVLAYAAIVGRDRLFRRTAILGALVSAMVSTATFIGFSAN